MLKAEDLIATTQQTDNHLGYLFWFSIGSQMVETDELKKKLIGSGLEEDWMPRRIRSVDAFRRATKEVERKRPTENPKIYENLLVREVFSDEKMIQRNLVVEQVNQNDKKLGYETEVAIIRLDKAKGTIYCEVEGSDISEICNEIKEKYYLYKNHYTSQHVRVMVSKILGSLAPTPMRENGVIYFVPRSMGDRVKMLVAFIRSLENSDAYYVPVVDSSDTRYMVNKRLNDHLDGLLNQCKHLDNLRKDQIKSLVEETNRAIRDFNEYTDLIDSEQEVYRTKIKMLRNEVFRIMNNVLSN